MRVSEGFADGTEKERPSGGFGGGFGVNPQNTPLKPQKTTPKGGWNRSIGSVPKLGSWKLVSENAGWWLLLDEATAKRKWRRLKLGSKVVRAGGANFWLQWNGENFGGGAETLRLAERFPEVEEWAIEKLKAGNV